MSVLIKGMKMPKAGNWKTIRIYYDGTCAEPNWQGDCKYMQGCEAVPVPPHGRLIDADALMNEMDKQENAMYEHGHEFTFSFKSGGDVCTAWYNVEFMVEDAPTILEAEVEE